MPDIAGPSPNPATNLLVAEIGMRIASRLFRRTAETGLLRMRIPAEEAHKIVEGRSLGHSLVSMAAARMATKSVRGALLVTGGLIAKSIFDRSIARRGPGRRKRALADKQAEKAE